MDERSIEALRAWIIEAGLLGTGEVELLHGFCERIEAAGLNVTRGTVVIDTLHPSFEGRVFRWRHDGAQEAVVQYGRTTDGAAAESWRRTAFYHLLSSNLEELRCSLSVGVPSPYLQFEQLRDEGHTDVLAFVNRFAGHGTLGEFDCIYSHWATQSPTGFNDDECAALRRLVPTLALAMKCTSLTGITATLLDVYLGRDAGRRVREGRIERGVAERLEAVLWFSDLQGYTAISDRIEPDEIIPLLNDYAEAVIAAVHAAGGDVLKFIGDGILAIFTADDLADACVCALQAEADMRLRVSEVNRRRGATGLPVTSVTLGLHCGEVFFGNIGSQDRFDFTTVGPAVNEVSRIVALCRNEQRTVVISERFAAASPDRERARMVGIGRFALRGVSRAQNLYTLEGADPDH